MNKYYEDNNDFMLEIYYSKKYSKAEILHVIFNDIFKGNLDSISNISFQWSLSYEDDKTRKVVITTTQKVQDVIGDKTLNEIYFSPYLDLSTDNTIFSKAKLSLMKRGN